MKNKYHIDVTPEEDSLFRDKPTKEKPFSSKKTFVTVLSLVIVFHLFAALAVIASNSTTTVPTLTQNATVVQESQPIEDPTPTPAPVVTTPNIKPVKVETDLKKEFVESKLKLSDSVPTPKIYIVKKGDTVYNICKKYKISSNLLVKLNKIENNKIIVGQKLKLM
jgi:LysM repeat protein